MLNRLQSSVDVAVDSKKVKRGSVRNNDGAGPRPAENIASTPSMVVPVNGVIYRIAVVPGPLVVKGETTASRVRHRERVIEVDDIIPAIDRWRVAALAVAYACQKIASNADSIDGRKDGRGKKSDGSKDEDPGSVPGKFQPIRVLGTVD